ncbi:MAG: sodium/proline symporter [Clostridia bacterium]|nr:sodium/proline symporter [Clostridia bacterium]
MQTVVYVIIGAYLLMMVVIGFLFSKKSENASGYFLGNRKLGPWVTAMSAEASDMSSWLLMGLPGVALAAGLAEAGWTAIGLGIGTYLNWLLVAKRLRIYSHRIDAVTVPEFFKKRFGDESGILCAISALVIIVFFIPYAASGFNACGTLFSALSGGKIPYLTAMLISAVVIAAYTTLGGFLAASTTDLIQSIVMTVALMAVVFFGIRFAGGWQSVVDNARALPGYLAMTSTYDAAANGVVPYGGLTIASTLAWGLGYFGMPHILLRFMAIRDASQLRTSRRIATVWVFIAMTVAILIGVIGGAAVRSGNIPLAIGDSQRIIIEIAKKMTENGLLPAILAGIILSGILASTMSTADSQLLAASSSISNDMLTHVFRVKLSQKTVMIISRATILVIALIAMYMARTESSVFRIVSFAWAGFGAAFGPVMLLALFWKRTNKYGAIAGMLSGGAMVFIWKYVISKLGGLFAIYELLPAFITGLIVTVVVSLLTKAPDKSLTDTFETVSREF